MDKRGLASLHVQRRFRPDMVLASIEKRGGEILSSARKACAVILLAWFLLVPEGMAASVSDQPVANPETIHQRLKAKNPGYNGQAQFATQPEIGLVGDLSGTGITDLLPLKGVPFGGLDLRGLQVSNLEPLRGMPLKLLGLEEAKVVDLKPLAGMKIEKLYLSNTAVSSLMSLAGMPLQELMLVGTKVQDLGPLKGASLQALWLNGAPVTDISPLAGCPLISLTLQGTKVSDLGPLSGMVTLKRLHIGQTPVSDLTPLQNLKLTRLIFTPSKIKKGMDVARSMKTLTEIGATLETKMTPTQFWALYDQGKMR